MGPAEVQHSADSTFGFSALCRLQMVSTSKGCGWIYGTSYWGTPKPLVLIQNQWVLDDCGTHWYPQSKKLPSFYSLNSRMIFSMIETTTDISRSALCKAILWASRTEQAAQIRGENGATFFRPQSPRGELKLGPWKNRLIFLKNHQWALPWNQTWQWKSLMYKRYHVIYNEDFSSHVWWPEDTSEDTSEIETSWTQLVLQSSSAGWSYFLGFTTWVCLKIGYSTPLYPMVFMGFADHEIPFLNG